MGKKSFFTLIFIISLCGLTEAQFRPEEISQWPILEERLKEAKITRTKEIGEGVTKPLRFFLEDELGEISGVWKNPKGMQKGFLEGWQYEIAAYEMDRLLDLNLVPPTVERKFKGKKGSLQFWAEAQYSLLEVMEKGINIPASRGDHVSQMKYMIRAFDSLIANEDRTQQNILYTKDWRVILIDHSRAFRSSREFTEQLMFGKNGIQGRKPIRQLPRTFVEKVRTLTFDKIKDAVGSYLEDEEIRAILARKELLLAEIDEMIQAVGEDDFLY